MTPEERITSEEKLLKLIENPRDIKGGFPAGIKRKVTKIPSLNNLRDMFKNIKINQHFTLKSINRNLLIITAMGTLGALFNFIKEYNDVKKEWTNITREKAISPEAQNSMFLVNFANTMNEARKRNIFTLLPVRLENTGTAEEEQIIGDLKLVGILWSDNPQVMIEDTKAVKTYFLSGSEMIGDFRIKQIFKDRVVITKGTHEWELR